MTTAYDYLSKLEPYNVAQIAAVKHGLERGWYKDNVSVGRLLVTVENLLSKLDTLTRELEAARAAAVEARGHLGAAISQTIPSDDKIIMEHVRAAFKLLDSATNDSESRRQAARGGGQDAEKALRTSPIISSIQARYDADKNLSQNAWAFDHGGTRGFQRHTDIGALLAHLSAARAKERTPGTVEVCSDCKSEQWSDPLSDEYGGTNEWADCTETGCPLRTQEQESA